MPDDAQARYAERDERGQRVAARRLGVGRGIGLAAGGLAAHQIQRDPMRETAISQIFLAVDPGFIGHASELNAVAEGIIESLRQATPVDPDRPVRYPGEQTLQLREDNIRLGVPVDPEIWEQIQGKTRTGNG